MKIFFDLDGTLIDSRERLYRLFQHLMPQSTLSFEEYWNFKRNKISHAMLLAQEFGYSTEQIGDFEKKWLERIELEEWLDLDKPFEGIQEYLAGLKEGNQLYVVTARQDEQRALNQLKKLGWEHLFEKVFVTNQKFDKCELIRQSGLEITASDWFVGDTGKDVETGKNLGLQTIAVLSGFLNEAALIPYEPTRIEKQVLNIIF